MAGGISEARPWTRKLHPASASPGPSSLADSGLATETRPLSSNTTPALAQQGLPFCHHDGFYDSEFLPLVTCCGHYGAICQVQPAARPPPPPPVRVSAGPTVNNPGLAEIPTPRHPGSTRCLLGPWSFPARLTLCLRSPTRPRPTPPPRSGPPGPCHLRSPSLPIAASTSARAPFLRS